jgi:signal transduction histidine kinase
MSALSILVLSIQIVLRQQYQNLTLGTKIQLYLNGAFFLPLVVVCALTLSVMSSTYRNDLNKAFLDNAEKIAQQLLPTLERKENQNTLNTQLQQIASIAALDINLYSNLGKLNQSSQNTLFAKKLISPYISPEAIASLFEARQNAILVPEQIGGVNFKVAYVALRSKNEGRLLGLLAVPFIESNAELDHQVSDVVGTMIILFTCILVLFIGLSYSVSRQLVVPLRLLTRRLKRTNLAKYSPLEWNSTDEIGLLVKEYNNMLKKLQVSTEALSKSEKESAWREMAKQVAHEIKNPLTPMKLTLQYLEQARAQNNPNQERITEKAIQTLLAQIENLSDIATSFAAFAQMPLPKQEPFNLVLTVKNTVNLYRSNNEINLTTHYAFPELWVTGDEKLISRIITNLILNAIQSVPESRVPEIVIHLGSDAKNAHFAISDNGSGIESSIADKIFVPNFSTKNGGTGIGLAVAKRGIEQLKGKIWFETKAGIGTTFYFELPLLEVLPEITS